MAQIGALSVKVSIDSSGVDINGKKVVRSVKEINAELRSSVNSLAKWGAAAGAAAIAVSAAIVRSSISSIDALAKTADKLGLTTDALAGLRFAAEQTGIAQTTLDMALQRSTRRIAEAAQGTGEAIKALDTLGLSAVDLAKKSPDQQMRDIADAMGQVEGEGAKLALAFKLFDSEGAALVNTLAGGSEALDEFQSQAETLGLAISRVDAAKVEAANDAINRMNSGLKGAAQSVTVTLAPVIAALADKFVESAIAAGGFGKVAEGAFLRTIKVVGFLADTLQGIKFAYKSLEVGFLALAVVIVQGGTEILRGFSVIFSTITGQLTNLINLANNIPSIVIPTDGIEAFTGRLIEQQNELREIGNTSVRALRKSKDGLDAIASEPIASEAIKAFADEAVTTAAEVAAEVQRIRDETAAGGLTPDEGSSLITQTKLESEAFLEELRQRYLTAQEIKDEAYALDLEKLRAARENGLLTEEEFLQRKQALDQQFAKDSADITKAEQNLKNRLVGAGGESLLSTLSSSAKRGTAIQRTAAKAQAVIAIATGAAKALALGLPAAIPEGIRVAAVGAASLAQIGAGGGSSIPTGSSSGATSSAPIGAASPVTSAASAAQQVVSVTVAGDSIYSSETVRNLIESINEQTSDGVQLHVNTA